MTIDDLLLAWSSAISRREGFGSSGSCASRNHNPGNLRAPGGKKDFWFGQTGVDERGFAVFDSDENGWGALRQNIHYALKHHGSLTVYQFMARYAPASDANEPISYAQAVAKSIGFPPETLLSKILSETENA
jgi:hypothetical protein